MNFVSGRALPALLCLLVVAFVAGCGRAAPPGAGLQRIPLAIVTEDGVRHAYQVEVAATSDEQAEGLMHRRAMARDHGMLFPFRPPRRAAFWMANTYIPLDMIFILSGGRIESVIADATPLSEEQRSSLGPVAAVLELNAGEVARIGAKPGDRVEYDLQGLQPRPE